MGGQNFFHGFIHDRILKKTLSIWSKGTLGQKSLVTPSRRKNFFPSGVFGADVRRTRATLERWGGGGVKGPGAAAPPGAKPFFPTP